MAKYKDEQIKRALKQCKYTYSCNGCPYYGKEDCFELLNGDALDLINRQEAKIDELETDLDAIHDLRNKRTYYRKFVDEVFRKQKGKELGEPDFDYIYRLYFEQQAEIKRLKDEAQNVRKKVLLEAASKFAGHSDYHGDTILAKLICMAEGKEVGVAKPLNKSKIKSEAIKEFAEKIKMEFYYEFDEIIPSIMADKIDNLVKEMVGEGEFLVENL